MEEDTRGNKIVAISSSNWLKMQIVRIHTRPQESESAFYQVPTDCNKLKPPEQGLRAVSLKLGCTLESPENLQKHFHAQDVPYANEIVISRKRLGKSTVKVLSHSVMSDSL